MRRIIRSFYYENILHDNSYYLCHYRTQTRLAKMRIAVEEHLKTRWEGLVFQVVPRDGPAFTFGDLSGYPFRVVHVVKAWTEVAGAFGVGG